MGSHVLIAQHVLSDCLPTILDWHRVPDGTSYSIWGNILQHQGGYFEVSESHYSVEL